jgi:hypothetical protein
MARPWHALGLGVSIGRPRQGQATFGRHGGLHLHLGGAGRVDDAPLGLPLLSMLTSTPDRIEKSTSSTYSLS